MLSRATLDERTVWRAIGGESTALPRAGDRLQNMRPSPATTREGALCFRCGARVQAREPQALAIAAALSCTAFVLLFPANVYPMNSSDLLGEPLSFTNFGYVEQLWHLPLWPLGVLTFWTSILNPAFMMACMAWCLLSAWRRWGRLLVLKTRLLQLVAEGARWSETGPRPSPSSSRSSISAISGPSPPVGARPHSSS